MSARTSLNWKVSFAVVALAVFAGPALAAGLEVIYTEIAGSPTSIVPGAKDAAGNPVVAQFLALNDLVMRPDGGAWLVRGQTNQGSTLDAILILGSGTTGNAFAQDGQPVQGGLAGELYDFFDTPVPAAWNASGKMVYNFRAKGGSSAIYEKMALFDPATQVHTIVLKMGDPALGVIDLPPAPSGDELFGNSMNSVYLLDDDRPAFVVTPITNCNAARYPGLFRGNTIFRQNGVSVMSAGETLKNIDLDECGGTSDGQHYYMKCRIADGSTLGVDALVVNDKVEVTRGQPIGTTGVTADEIFYPRMLQNGTWLARGDDPAGGYWALRDGLLIAKTGDLVTAGGAEHWVALAGLAGTDAGDLLICGGTDAADVNANRVLVVNGEVVVREGAAIDVDGNGAFDDDVYLNDFKGALTLHLTADGWVYFLATLRNGAGTNLGDAFLRLRLAPAPCLGDSNCDAVVSWRDIDFFIAGLNDNTAAWAALFPPPGPTCAFANLDVNADGHVTWRDIDPFIAVLNTNCP